MDSFSRDTTALIALAESNRILQALIRDVLSDAGYRITLWRADETFPAWLTRVRPGVALIDLTRDGCGASWESVRDVRGDPTLRALPLLISSADVAYLRAHADTMRAWQFSVIEKPFDAEMLLARIRGLLTTGNIPTEVYA